MALQNYGVKTIKSFYNEGKYYIPNYQRDYSWGSDEVSDLWQDILTVYENDIKEYFLGQTVIHIEDNKKRIIDGQQRTITLFLLLLSIKNELNKIYISNEIDCSENTKNTINKTCQKINNLLGIIDEQDDEDIVHLGLNDKDFFKKLIYHTEQTIKTKPIRNPQVKLIKTYNYFTKEIKKIIEDNDFNVDENIEKIIEIYSTITKNIKLLYIETNDECEAFMIFETLNARGRDLETSDLLKNFLFKEAGPKLDSIKNNWNKMADKLEGFNITHYIRCIWNSKNDFTREKVLYKNIRETIKTPKNCLEFSEFLKDNVDLYLTLYDPNSYQFFTGSPYKEEIKDFVCGLSQLKIKTYYPLVISYYNQNKNKPDIQKDIYELLNAIQKLIIRDIVIAKNSPSSYEEFFSTLALKISEMEIIQLKDIITAIKEKSIDDESFKINFLNYKEKNTTSAKDKIRYILRKIVNYNAKSMKIKTDNNIIHIEHIMPQSNSKWKVDESIHTNNLWKLGNLTLLNKKLNEDIGNDLFSVKVIEYAKEDINITKVLTKYNTWNESTIKQRQEELYDFANKIWSF